MCTYMMMRLEIVANIFMADIKTANNDIDSEFQEELSVEDSHDDVTLITD